MKTVTDKGRQDNHEGTARWRMLQQAYAAEVARRAGDGASFEAQEQMAMQVSNELGRQYLQRTLQSMAQRYPDRVVIETAASPGKPAERGEYKRHCEGQATYHSLCGPLEVGRDSYRKVGVHNGPTAIPLEVDAGLMEGLTPAMAQSVASGYASATLRDYLDTLTRAYRCAPPLATVERKAKALAEQARAATMAIEPVLRQHETVGPEVAAIALGLDRTAVPMAEPRPPSQRRLADRRKPRVRRPPTPIDINWRMDYVGTVSMLDRHGQAVVTRRYRAASEQGPDAMLDRMMADLKCIRRARYKLPIVVAQDGAPELWNVVRAKLKQNRVQHWHEVLDIYHARERISECIDLLEGCPTPKTRLKRAWLDALETDPTAPQRIVGSIRRRLDALRGQQRSLVRSHLRYFNARLPLMTYAKLRANHLPIGSGVTEGACKSLIAARAKRNGQRWTQPGLTGVLNLRALRQSDRFDTFWSFFAQRFCATVVASDIANGISQ